MKLRLLALATSLAFASGAQALTPAQIESARTAGNLKEIYFSGASALRLSFAAYMAEVCDTATMHVFFDSTAGSAHRAYSCTLAKAVGNYAIGTQLVVYKRDAGGSGQGVNPVATATAIDHMSITSAGCSAVAGNPNFTDIQAPNYLCAGTAKKVSDAGISDVEPDLLNQAPNLPDGASPADLSTLAVKPFVQGIFAVAVNKQAYLALQKTQGLDNAGALDESEAKRPSLPTTFVRAMLTGGLSATNTTKRGWGLVISEAVDPSVNTKQFNVCRRAPGSGTQAASNVYFAQNPCAGDSKIEPLRTQGTIAASGSGPYAVVEGAGTGNVETCLGTTVNSIAGAYGIAVLGRENNPLANGGDKGYRYVKLDGADPVRWNATTQKGATTGDYDFVFESTLQYNTSYLTDADKVAFVTAISTSVPKPAALAAADADTQQGVMSPSGAWASLGQYPALTAAAKPFASRVTRTAGQSCTVLKMAR